VIVFTPVEVIVGIGILFLILWLPLIAYFLQTRSKHER
jgi:hypothetical protein